MRHTQAIFFIFDPLLAHRELAYGVKNLLNNFFFIFFWKIWLPSQNALRKGGFVNLFKKPHTEDFHFYIFMKGIYQGTNTG